MWWYIPLTTALRRPVQTGPSVSSRPTCLKSREKKITTVCVHVFMTFLKSQAVRLENRSMFAKSTWDQNLSVKSFWASSSVTLREVDSPSEGVWALKTTMENVQKAASTQWELAFSPATSPFSWHLLSSRSLVQMATRLLCVNWS